MKLFKSAAVLVLALLIPVSCGDYKIAEHEVEISNVTENSFVVDWNSEDSDSQDVEIWWKAKSEEYRIEREMSVDPPFKYSGCDQDMDYIVRVKYYGSKRNLRDTVEITVHTEKQVVPAGSFPRPLMKADYHKADNKVVLTWEPVEGAAYYKLHRLERWGDSKAYLFNGTQTSFTDDISDNTSYMVIYRLCAMNEELSNEECWSHYLYVVK